MKKEFVASSQFAGIAIFLQYTRIPIVSDFGYLAFFLLWKICGAKYSFFFIALVQLATLPLNIQRYVALPSVFQILRDFAINFPKQPQSFVSTFPIQHPSNNLTIGFFVVFVFLLIVYNYYFTYKPIRKFFKILSDIQARVRWRCNS